jgi:hypothetical protein
MARKPFGSALVAASTLALVASLTSAPAAASPRPAAVSDNDPVTWCDASSAPCISAVTRGHAVIDSSDPTWDVSGVVSVADGATQILWNVSKNGAAVHDPSTGENYSSMGPGEAGNNWSITFDLGNAFVPRVTDTYADDVAVTRDDHGDGTYDVTVSGNVVTMAANAECDTSVFPAVCPVQASADVTYFGGDLGDFGQWTDEAQRADFYGMDSWTNVEVTYIPPTISGDPLRIEIPLQNSYKLSTGNVFEGFYHVVIPNHFLQDMGIDDPSTLTPSGVDATIGAGAVSVSPGAEAVQVDATNVTFPVAPRPPGVSPAAADKKKHTVLRTLKVKRGTITPKAPRKVKAKRVTARKAKVHFGKVKPRGSKIKGYRARCVAHHQVTRTGKAKHSPITVKKLSAGHHYTCQVRAKSKAGLGKWSKKDKA